MKSKPIVMAALLGLTAGSVIFASQILIGGNMPNTMLTADEPLSTAHTVTITSLPFASLYRNKTGEMQNKYLAMPLTTPGFYCQLEVSGFQNVEVGNGHLFTLTMSDPAYLTWFCIGVQAPKDEERLFETEADYPSNPLNVVGFKDLTGIDVYESASSEVCLKVRDDVGYKDFPQSYDSVNRIYSVTGGLTGKVDPFRFEFADFNANQKFIVDKIVLHYNC